MDKFQPIFPYIAIVVSSNIEARNEHSEQHHTRDLCYKEISIDHFVQMLS